MIEKIFDSLLLSQPPSLFSFQFLMMVLFLTWNLFWKGWALWKAAKRSDKKWFIVLMIFQSMGLLDIIYIFLITRKNKAGVV